MGKKLLVLIGTSGLILLIAGLVFSQAKDEKQLLDKRELHPLGRNLAVNLVMEPAQEEGGITIITATEDFSVDIEVEKGKERIALQFEGKIKLKESSLDLGKIKLREHGLILVSYRLKTHAVNKPKAGGFVFGLEGSVLVEDNEQVTIAKSKDMVLRLKVSTLNPLLHPDKEHKQ